MKKILFMVINMNIGGVEKALLNMLSEIPKDKFEVTILMLEEYGGFLDHIPKWVNVQVLESYNNIKEYVNEPPQIVALELLKDKKYIKAFKTLFYHILSKITDNREHYYKYVLRDYDQMENQYDLAIAYHGPMDFISYFVARKIKAKKKVQWIHFDVTKIHINHKFTRKIYGLFDNIFIVSEKGKDKFLEVFPEFKEKTKTFFNIVSAKLVRDSAGKGVGFTDDFKGTRILTVGRLCTEKGQDLTILVLARLVEDGFNVKWYCVGEGSARKKYEELIDKYNVKDKFVLLGSDPNPYPYMKQCDIYVQSSRHEGYCITLAEARCFDNPIITTNFTGAREQIIHEKTGLIVECNEQQIYSDIKKLLDDKYLMDTLRKNLQHEIVNTTNNMEKLFQIMNGIDKTHREVSNEENIIYGQ
ncbi:glycosyltransferase [Clostridium grantii]|uniref:Glycosyltransferase involved in cell wall bisynthesis n=1 Tax=Clostridium grantii DSM 8605 TaxID=1121316 RepID=A0A1M5UZE8_9CLOT|nr:glycosyltransferase [Clostridium grantii]SHH68371.1 Glycosyltransferase involved in cell wall bisynthesis [Clostridium grantii DSM 8605]